MQSRAFASHAVSELEILFFFFARNFFLFPAEQECVSQKKIKKNFNVGVVGAKRTVSRTRARFRLPYKNILYNIFIPISIDIYST